MVTAALCWTKDTFSLIEQLIQRFVFLWTFFFMFVTRRKKIKRVIHKPPSHFPPLAAFIFVYVQFWNPGLFHASSDSSPSDLHLPRLSCCFFMSRSPLVALTSLLFSFLPSFLSFISPSSPVFSSSLPKGVRLCSYLMCWNVNSLRWQRWGVQPDSLWSCWVTLVLNTDWQAEGFSWPHLIVECKTSWYSSPSVIMRVTFHTPLR